MLTEPLRRILRWRPGALAWNTAHATGWNFVRVSLQAANLVLMARVFGASGYGLLAGTVALYATVGQFVGLGSGIALVRHAARDPSILASRTIRTQLVFFGTGVAMFIVIWPASLWILPNQLTPFALACLAGAELIAAPAVLPTVYYYQAQERMGMFGAALAVVPLARLASILVAFALPYRSIELFAIIYAGTVSVSAILVVLVTVRIMPPHPAKINARTVLIEGLPYAVTGAVATAGNELDKTIVLSRLGAEAAGHYAAPFRIIQAAVMPISSLMLAAVPRMFRMAGGGNEVAKLKAMLKVAFLYLAIVSCVLWFLSPYLHHLLGRDFIESAPILRGLLAYFVLNGFRQIVSASLTTSDFQWLRNAIEGFASALSILGMIVLIPSYGIRGAIMAITLAETVYLIIGAVAIRVKTRPAT